MAPAGTKFMFKWGADGDQATIDGLDGENIDGLKAYLDGKYEKK